jgi:hypothetical protein
MCEHLHEEEKKGEDNVHPNSQGNNGNEGLDHSLEIEFE